MAVEKLALSKIEALSPKLPFTAGENGEQREARSRLHHDGGGLFFRVVRPVDENATKPVCSWVLRYRDLHARTREMGPGSYEDINLLDQINRGPDGKPHWIDPDSHRPISVHGFRSTFANWVNCSAMCQ